MKLSKVNIMRKALLGAVAVVVTAGLVGCAGAPSNNQTNLLEAADGWPAVTDNWYHGGGKFIDPNNILRITEGQTKDQVRNLLGNPHYSEGFFGVREWDYVFNLYTGQGNEYITCQYKVLYDRDMALESTHWRDQQCPALLSPVEKKVEPKKQVLTLSGDVLFDFDSSVLTLEGKRSLDRLLIGIGQEFNNPTMAVAGFTDRFGSDAYNLRLSQQRADVVRQYLIQKGVNPRLISARGMGSTNPVVECPGARPIPSVTECLGPNRRVVITVTETR